MSTLTPSPVTSTVAMHMSDGIIDAPVSALFGIIAFA
ncbi:cobalamin biosynthesis protein CbiM, partial [Streptomyces sp. SID10244]|nr:cobalamin biosynthesis protein CbiM [Streptomyces sp. SID10244]